MTMISYFSNLSILAARCNHRHGFEQPALGFFRQHLSHPEPGLDISEGKFDEAMGMQSVWGNMCPEIEFQGYISI